MSDRLAPTERHAFLHQGRTIYEWDQTLSEVNIYVQLPPGARAKQLYVDITSAHLRIGITPGQPYLDHELVGRVKPSDSFWTVDDGVLTLQLCKADKGEPWASALVGHALDPLRQQSEQKRLLLERFQEEHPGFDFSGAEVNGEAPNPRTFMGGLAGS